MLHNAGMPRAKKTYQPTYIRAWRQHRAFSLARLADRLVDPATFEPMLTPTSLSRIERGLQPYSQPVLEAIADALGCQPADLIMRNPKETEAIWSIWEVLRPAQRKQAIEFLKVIQNTQEAA